jgi:hypothetical protein
MWSRFTLVGLGFWLQLSPFVFHHPSTETTWWIVDAGCGLIVILLAAASLQQRSPAAEPLIILVGALLIGVAYIHFGNPPPAAQNRAVIGLLLMLFASVPLRKSPARDYRALENSEPGSTRRLPTCPTRAMGDTFTLARSRHRTGGRRKASWLRGRGDQPNSRL